MIVVHPAAVPTPQPISAAPPDKKNAMANVEIVGILPMEGVEDPGYGVPGVPNSLANYVGVGEIGEPNEVLGPKSPIFAPVNIGVGTTNECLGIFNLPVMQHLSRSQSAPKFSNKKEDWLDFVWKFENWVRVISAGKKLSDAETLQLFNTCLPESLQKELSLLEKKRGRPCTFVEFRAELEARFGKAQSEHLRKKWLGVQIARGFGKIGVQQLDEFRVNFESAWVDVPNTTPEESRRILLEKLPPFMRRWVIESEAKKNEISPNCRIGRKRELGKGIFAPECWYMGGDPPC